MASASTSKATRLPTGRRRSRAGADFALPRLRLLMSSAAGYVCGSSGTGFTFVKAALPFDRAVALPDGPEAVRLAFQEVLFLNSVTIFVPGVRHAVLHAGDEVLLPPDLTVVVPTGNLAFLDAVIERGLVGLLAILVEGGVVPVVNARAVRIDEHFTPQAQAAIVPVFGEHFGHGLCGSFGRTSRRFARRMAIARLATDQQGGDGDGNDETQAVARQHGVPPWTRLRRQSHVRCRPMLTARGAHCPTWRPVSTTPRAVFLTVPVRRVPARRRIVTCAVSAVWRDDRAVGIASTHATKFQAWFDKLLCA